jgi:excisionase family DNA binding protein
MELWTLKETAKYTRMSLAFWRKQLWLRSIPAIKIGRAVRLDAEAVRSFLEARTRPAKRAAQ